MRPVKVTIYTDPGCPCDFNSQRQETQLLWHYGHGLDVTWRMIVLGERSASFEERGLSPEVAAARTRQLIERYGMPMRPHPPRRIAATVDACRACVGARLHDPERAHLLLRALRRRAFAAGQPLDDPETIRAAATDAGIRSDAVEGWIADAGVGAALREDMAASRAPLPEALALPERLSTTGDGLRYSTTSAVFERGDRRIVSGGFQPFGVYEVAIANVAPELERRPPPASAEEVLAWARYPLATAEVAALRGIAHADARAELERSGARWTPAAGDGFWTSNASQPRSGHR